MSALLPVLHAARQSASTALQGSRPDAHASGYPVLLRFGKISAVQGGSLYQVNFGGDPAILVDGCPVYPDAELEMDEDIVALEFPGRPIPIILGLGACRGVSIFEMGIYFDSGIS